MKKWKIDIIPIFFGTILAIMDIAMMSTAKLISQGKVSKTIGTPFIMLLYSTGPLIFLKALKYEGMVIMNLMWDLISDIIVTLNGVFIFKETLAPVRWLGVCLSMVSVCLMAYSDT